MSPPCLAMSPATERRSMAAFVEGRVRLSHSSAIPQHFIISILLVNEVQKGKHSELQKDRKTLERLSQLCNF